MGSGVGKLVGPIGGVRVLHWLAIRIEGRRQVRMRRVIGGSYGGWDEVEGCQGEGWDQSKGKLEGD